MIDNSHENPPNQGPSKEKPEKARWSLKNLIESGRAWINWCMRHENTWKAFKTQDERVAHIAARADSLLKQAEADGWLDDPVLRENVTNDWRGLKALEYAIRQDPLPDMVENLYTSCTQDARLCNSATFTEATENDTKASLEKAIVFISQSFRRPRTLASQPIDDILHFTINWSHNDGQGIWENGANQETNVPSIRSVIENSLSDAGFDSKVRTVLTERIIDEVRAGTIVLPSFRLENAMQDKTCLIIIPPILKEAPPDVQPPYVKNAPSA